MKKDIYTCDLCGECGIEKKEILSFPTVQDSGGRGSDTAGQGDVCKKCTVKVVTKAFYEKYPTGFIR